MENMESKMASILGNPQMMEKIQALAQSFGAEEASAPPPDTPPEPTSQSASPFPELDLGMIQKISGLIGKSQIDPNQQSLLRALAPFINAQRVQKLERAMRAAKMANLASALFRGGKLGV